MSDRSRNRRIISLITICIGWHEFVKTKKLINFEQFLREGDEWDGYFQRADNAGRAQPVFVWNEYYGTGAGAAGRKRAEASFKPAYHQPGGGAFDRAFGDGSDSKLLGNYGDGGRLCEFWSDDLKAGHQCDHGSKHRDYRDGLDFKSFRN